MTPSNVDEPVRLAQSSLERAYIEEHLRSQGFSLEKLHDLPSGQAHALMREASLFASMRLTEVESRSQLIEELHGGPTPM